jgi:hypothetical protein
MIEQKPLKRIPQPPDIYVKFRAITYGLDQEEYERVSAKFYKENSGKQDIIKYRKLLEKIVMHNFENSLNENYKIEGEGISPIEKIEVIEADGKKHGKVKWMMIYDIEYFYHKDKLMQRKLYIPLKWNQNY